ncbi:hypothetical protein BRARA_H02261 [Brassica rapa]|uniref:Transcription factor CBF/NF-Y/archaeal histone domain-containing protein n=1 Tax=Brassica campestris TaxID=3711 RepID=A0A397YKN7_BRACM|nr:hypothetical protein BRARA_H02261 [Brassica rapa]
MPPEQDQYLPIASVTRIMRKILPSEARISEEAKENILICATKYISFVTTEASDTCQSERRTTITAGDMLSAMSNLGFEDYVEPLNVFINRYRLSETDRGCSLRGGSSSFDPAYGGSGIGFHGPPHYGPPPHGTIPYGPLTHSMDLGGGDRYYPNGSGQDGTTGGGGSSSSMNGMPFCDQCGQYK